MYEIRCVYCGKILQDYKSPWCDKRCKLRYMKQRMSDTEFEKELGIEFEKEFGGDSEAQKCSETHTGIM